MNGFQDEVKHQIKWRRNGGHVDYASRRKGKGEMRKCIERKCKDRRSSVLQEQLLDTGIDLAVCEG
jgi:hypothetical protein